MTDTTERAELLALADDLDRIRSSSFLTQSRNSLGAAASFLRRLAAQDQNAVAWLQSRGGAEILCKNRLDPGGFERGWTEKPLYLSPPPAAGWNEAIEAARLAVTELDCMYVNDERVPYAGIPANEESAILREVVQKCEAAIEALRANAPPDTGAWKSAPPGRSSLPPNQGESEHTVTYASGGADAGVGVKPLEWHQHPDGETKRYEGVSVIGNNYVVFQAWWGAQNKWGWIGGGEFYHSEVEARQACNADYERRVLCALTNQPLAVEDGEVIDREAYWRGAYERMASRNQELSNAVDSNASAEARLREALTGLQRQSNAAYCRYIDQMSKPECLGFEAKLLSGKFSKIELDAHARAGEMIGAHRALSDAVKQINEALSAHTHTSDCDKQECMGDMAPGDPKDLAELLAKPSVLEPSDRTADVTWGELHAFILKHGDEWEDEGVAARALLDAFTVGRR